jgi:hypothetical protein
VLLAPFCVGCVDAARSAAAAHVPVPVVTACRSFMHTQLM